MILSEGVQVFCGELNKSAVYSVLLDVHMGGKVRSKPRLSKPLVFL